MSALEITLKCWRDVMYKWEVKNYGKQQHHHPALGKRMDVLKMKGKYERISVRNGFWSMIGYNKYLVWLEHGRWDDNENLVY